MATPEASRNMATNVDAAFNLALPDDKTKPGRTLHRAYPGDVNSDGTTECDLIIVGAGIYGIQAARTYLTLHPTRHVVVLETSSDCVGGVWSSKRVYEEFWTQTPLGILEFSDLPMHDIPDEDQHLGFFRAKHVSQCLEAYVKREAFGEGNGTLRDRIKFGRRVIGVVKEADQWVVKCEVLPDEDVAYSDPGVYEEEEVRESFAAPRLIDASGLTSVTNFPPAAFRNRTTSHKCFRSLEHELDYEPQDLHPYNLVVVGGAKSAADVAYTLCKRGHKVTWVIRQSGSGPAAFLSAKGKGGYRNSNESFYTRAVGLFLVSIFSASTGFPWLSAMLNRTWLGQKLIQTVWTNINRDAHRTADYDREDGRANGFYNLRPDHEIFWQNDSSGINQRGDFFDVIATKCKVIRSDIIDDVEKIGSPHGWSNVLPLKNGDYIKADKVIFCTGWRDGAKEYLDKAQTIAFGLSSSQESISAETAKEWSRLEIAAEKEILATYPILDSPWAHSQRAFKQANLDEKTPSKGDYEAFLKDRDSPYRLYKSIVPISDPSILFLGRVMLGNHFRAAETQALFACAVLDGHTEENPSDFKLPSKEVMKKDVAKTVAWCRRRYLAKGLKGNWFYWDLVPYTDMLLAELGLSSHRKGGWWQDLTGTCWARDLKGLIGEYKEKYPGDLGGAKTE